MVSEPKRELTYRWGDKINNTCSVRINVTWEHIRLAIIAVEKQYVLHILSVYLALVTQNAMRMRALFYCHLWPVHLYHIFPHLINGRIFA